MAAIAAAPSNILIMLRRPPTLSNIPAAIASAISGPLPLKMLGRVYGVNVRGELRLPDDL